MRTSTLIVTTLLLSNCGPGQHQKAQQPAPAKTASTDDQPAPPPHAIIRHEHDLRTYLPGSTPPVLPSYLPLYPDAKVIAGFQRPSRFGGGGSVIFTCAAQPADVIAFYEKKAVAANFTQTTNTATGATLNFAAGAGLSHIQVIAQPIQGGAHVQIFWAGTE